MAVHYAECDHLLSDANCKRNDFGDNCPKFIVPTVMQTKQGYNQSITYVLVLKLNSNSAFVICNPLWPEKTYIQSRATATGKLQHVGGRSPFCSISEKNKKEKNI